MVSCLPNVDFRTATTVRAHAGVGVVGGLLPALNVGLATDELEVTGALSIAVLREGQ